MITYVFFCRYYWSSSSGKPQSLRHSGHASFILSTLQRMSELWRENGKCSQGSSHFLEPVWKANTMCKCLIASKFKSLLRNKQVICNFNFFLGGGGREREQYRRLNYEIFITAWIWNSSIERRKKMHFQFVKQFTRVLISLAMNSRSLVISFFVILFGLTVTAYDKWKHCKPWSNNMHLQSNLLILNWWGWLKN